MTDSVKKPFPLRRLVADDEGHPSSMHLMSYLAFAAAVVLIFMDGCDANFGNAMSEGFSINEYVMYLLGAVFKGKTLSKFAETILGRSSANLVNRGADEQGGKPKPKRKKRSCKYAEHGYLDYRHPFIPPR